MTFISDIDPSLPTSGASAGQGDDEIRQLKSDVKDSFPNVSGAVTATHAELNKMDGCTATTEELNYVLDSGATTLFVQSSAPTGWTKSTSHNNKALRIVSGSGGGSGGSVAFTTAFSSSRATTSAGSHNHGGSAGGTTLSVSHMPAHNHGGGSHTHSYIVGASGTGSNPQRDGTTAQTNSYTTGSSGTIIDTQGGGASHNHSISSEGSHSHTTNLAVQYVDAIICTKDAY